MGFINNGRLHIVITNRVLRYAFSKNNSIESLVAHGEMELPKNTIRDGTIVNRAALLENVNRLVHENKWKRKKVYFAVPDDTVVIRQLQIPKALTEEEAGSYIKTQVGTSFYLPFANPEIAIEFLDVDEQKRNILLFAYPKEKITAFKEVFEEAGLKPAAADLTSLSVYRYYYSKQQDEKANLLHIQWNKDTLVVTVFQNHKAIFTRYMKIETPEETIGEESAIQIINEYIVEINRIIDFYQYSITKGEGQINKLLLSGDFSFLSAVKDSLLDAINLPIHGFSSDVLPVKYMDVLGLVLKRDLSRM